MIFEGIGVGVRGDWDFVQRHHIFSAKPEKLDISLSLKH